ncbi:MAG: enoyl-CoA hydratase/isomerase family protein [Chloroflexi bacterium]|nr:enoyl-CoA hydratase/isomerase family protein [Chloroflexota bacterium]
MSYDNVLYEKQRGGVLITLNRPETLNALSAELRADLRSALETAQADPDIRAVVLTGAGRAFSAGANMGGGRGVQTAWPYGVPEGKSVAEFLDQWRTGDRNGIDDQIWRWEYPKPIISAINGWCLGAASWLALTCHMSVMADDAVIGQPEVRHISNTNFIWVLLAGYKNALRYSLTGDHIDAAEALRIGLVNKVAPRDQLLDECFTIVERIALVSPETVKINQAVATMGLEMMGLHKAWTLNAELAAFAHTSQREEYKRPLEDAMAQGGLRSYIQKRDEPFQPEPFGPRSRRA